MKHFKILIFYLIVCGSIVSLQAQLAVNTGAIIATNANGESTEASIGQVFYQQNQNAGGIEIQGVIQPLTTEVLSVEENNPLALESTVFPNPTSNNVELRLTSYNNKLSYKVYNVLGKTVLSQPISGLQTSIPLADKASGIYILQIMEDSRPVKTVKIIKQ